MRERKRERERERERESARSIRRHTRAEAAAVGLPDRRGREKIHSNGDVLVSSAHIYRVVVAAFKLKSLSENQLLTVVYLTNTFTKYLTGRPRSALTM